MGHKVAERNLLLAKLFNPTEAFQVGLVDELATDKDDALAKCTKQVLTFAKTNPDGYQKTKWRTRGVLIEAMKAKAKEDTQWHYEFYKTEKFQKTVSDYLASVKKRSQQKKQ